MKTQKRSSHQWLVLAYMGLMVSPLLLLMRNVDAQELPVVNGGISGMAVTDTMTKISGDSPTVRSAALLGIHISKYLSVPTNVIPVKGAITGIEVQDALLLKQSEVSDPDFDLLQAFGDALGIDVADLLNRSQDRQETLDKYSTALTNVAEKANTRYKELTTSAEAQQEELRTVQKERSVKDREMNNAMRAKDYTLATEKQKEVSELDAKVSEATLKLKQTNDIIDSLETLLELFAEKILAIQENREALIAGITVVDLPGAEDLKVLEQGERRRSTGGSRRSGGSTFDGLFDFEGVVGGF